MNPERARSGLNLDAQVEVARDHDAWVDLARLEYRRALAACEIQRRGTRDQLRRAVCHRDLRFAACIDVDLRLAWLPGRRLDVDFTARYADRAAARCRDGRDAIAELDAPSTSSRARQLRRSACKLERVDPRSTSPSRLHA